MRPFCHFPFFNAGILPPAPGQIESTFTPGNLSLPASPRHVETPSVPQASLRRGDNATVAQAPGQVESTYTPGNLTRSKPHFEQPTMATESPLTTEKSKPNFEKLTMATDFSIATEKSFDSMNMSGSPSYSVAMGSPVAKGSPPYPVVKDEIHKVVSDTFYHMLPRTSSRKDISNSSVVSPYGPGQSSAKASNVQEGLEMDNFSKFSPEQVAKYGLTQPYVRRENREYPYCLLGSNYYIDYVGADDLKDKRNGKETDMNANLSAMSNQSSIPMDNRMQSKNQEEILQQVPVLMNSVPSLNSMPNVKFGSILGPSAMSHPDMKSVLNVADLNSAPPLPPRQSRPGSVHAAESSYSESQSHPDLQMNVNGFPNASKHADFSLEPQNPVKPLGPQRFEGVNAQPELNHSINVSPQYSSQSNSNNVTPHHQHNGIENISNITPQHHRNSSRDSTNTMSQYQRNSYGNITSITPKHERTHSDTPSHAPSFRYSYAESEYSFPDWNRYQEEYMYGDYRKYPEQEVFHDNYNYNEVSSRGRGIRLGY